MLDYWIVGANVANCRQDKLTGWRTTQLTEEGLSNKLSIASVCQIYNPQRSRPWACRLPASLALAQLDDIGEIKASRRDQLVVRTLSRRFVFAPAQKAGGVAKAVPLQLLKTNLTDEYRFQ